jgi:hypothetical protein
MPGAGSFKIQQLAWHQWLKPIILATWEAEIRRITIRSQPGQIAHKTLCQKKKENHHKNRAGGVTQDEGPELKHSTEKKKDATAELQQRSLKPGGDILEF